jgi:transmembrane sensor
MNSADEQERYRELALKWQEGTLTPEEREEYSRWFNQDDGTPLVVPASFAASEEALKGRILQRIEPQTLAVPKVPTYRRLYRVAAAAIIILLAGTVVAIVGINTANKRAQVSNLQTDALPGGNRAILTLSGGRQILLDIAHSGALAREGSVNIVKTDSGKLAYQMTAAKPSEVLYNTLATPRGGQYNLTLPDGTHVWLNAVSSLRYPVTFAGLKQREVSLTGEAYFEVAKNVAQPFKVNINNNLGVEVLGTSFNINAYDDEKAVKATLIEGSVKVSEETQQSVVLKPGEQSQLAGGKMEVVLDVDIDQVMAWKNGLFSFNHVGLEELMRQISRWYDVEVQYEGGKIPDLRFGGEMGRDLNLSQVLAGLQQVHVHFRIEGKKLIVMP